MLIDFRERGRERGRETLMWERNIDQLVAFPKGPDQESNTQPFGLLDDAPTNWQWPGLIVEFLKFMPSSENLAIL